MSNLKFPRGYGETKRRLIGCILRAQERYGFCDRSLSEFAGHLKISRSTVRDHLDDMCASGVITNRNPPRHTPRWTVDLVRLEAVRSGTSCTPVHVTESVPESGTESVPEDVPDLPQSPVQKTYQSVNNAAQQRSAAQLNYGLPPIEQADMDTPDSNDVDSQKAPPSAPPATGAERLSVLKAKIAEAIPTEPPPTAPPPSWHILDRMDRGEVMLPTQAEAMRVLALHWGVSRQQIEKAWSRILPATMKSGHKPEHWFALLPFATRWPGDYAPASQIVTMANQIASRELASPRDIQINAEVLNWYRTLAEGFPFESPRFRDLLSEYGGDYLLAWEKAGARRIRAKIDEDAAERAEKAREAAAAITRILMERGNIKIVEPPTTENGK